MLKIFIGVLMALVAFAIIVAIWPILLGGGIIVAFFYWIWKIGQNTGKKPVH